MLNKILKLGEMAVLAKQKEKEMKSHALKCLFWETTLTCNARCKHCGSYAETKKYKDQLTTEEIKKVFKEIAEDFPVKNIYLNVTGGEPLVRKDLFEVMDYAANDLHFKWGMTTNGILLNEQNIENLKRTNIDTISISIDGLEETHDDFRGVKGSYKKIIENIKKLKEANFLNCLMVTTVVNKENMHELEDLYKILENLGIDLWRLLDMDPIGRANDNKDLLLSKKEIQYMLDFIKQKRKEKGHMYVKYGCSGFLGLDYEKEVKHQYSCCLTGINIGSILYNGDIFVCPNVPRNEKTIQGNVRNNRFKDIWDNKFEIYRNKETRKCQDCKNWDICLGGAFHTWNLEENKPNRCIYKIIEG